LNAAEWHNVLKTIRPNWGIKNGNVMD
jgi:hypothetical protein